VNKLSSIVAAIIAVLLSSLFAPAAVSQNPATAVPANTATWKINCPGVRNVPMTADSQQALPLQLISNLKCGEEVEVLDNTEGYTAKIKTADGKIGFVAVMYLKKSVTPRRAPALESAIIENGIARWQEGAPGCDHFMSNGILVESLTVNGVTVQVSLHDTGWKLRANVGIANNAAESIQVQPSQFILDELGPHGKPLFYQDPAELAKNVTHQVLWTESIAAPLSSAPRASTVTATNIDYRYSVAPSVSTQNYLLQQQNAEEDAVRNKGKQTLVNTARQIQTLALKSSSVAPGEKIAGAVWFERGKNPAQLVLRVPLENQTFEFPLSFQRK
jgi:hypothetical protein